MESSYRIFTEAEYEIFSAAEWPFYDMCGLYPWSGVRDRESSGALAALYDDAVSGVEALAEDPSGADRDYVMAEAARRVAVAQYYVMTGELPARPTRTVRVRAGKVEATYFEQ